MKYTQVRALSKQVNAGSTLDSEATHFPVKNQLFFSSSFSLLTQSVSSWHSSHSYLTSSSFPSLLLSISSIHPHPFQALAPWTNSVKGHQPYLLSSLDSLRVPALSLPGFNCCTHLSIQFLAFQTQKQMLPSSQWQSSKLDFLHDFFPSFLSTLPELWWYVWFLRNTHSLS